MKKIIYTLSFVFAGCFAAEAPTEQNHPHVITDLPAFAHAWAHAAITDLSQDELELLGTFLYYDTASSQYELTLRNALLDLQRGSQILAFKIMNQNNVDETAHFCAQLSALLEKIEKDFAPSRNYCLSCWQLCNKQIEQESYTKLALAIEQLKLLGQRALNNWAKANQEEIIKLLEKNCSGIDDTLRKMNVCKKALDELVDGTFPISQETEFVEIQTVQNALGISHVLYEALFHAGLATDEIMSTSFGLINLNTIIFGTLYQEFYKALEEKNMLPMHIVIDEHGYIPTQSRTKTLPEFSLNTNPS